MKFVEEQNARLSQDGSCELKDSHSFVYEAISKELYIGNVYLRVYNNQPDSEITEPERFCLALVDFISHLVHNAPALKVDTQINGDVTTESSVEHRSADESSVEHRSADESSVEHRSADESSSSVDEKPTNMEETELIKNLQYGLTSLQVQIRYLLLPISTDTVINILFSLNAALIDEKSQFSFCCVLKGKVEASLRVLFSSCCCYKQHSPALLDCVVTFNYVCPLLGGNGCRHLEFAYITTDASFISQLSRRSFACPLCLGKHTRTCMGNC